MGASDLYRNYKLLGVSKMLRKNLTQQEKHLWYDYLANYPVRWYRQRILDSFVVDFFCYKALLAVELDGSQHYSERGLCQDAERTKVLEKYGIQVLRFSNIDVDTNFEGVCLVIDRAVKERLGQ